MFRAIVALACGASLCAGCSGVADGQQNAQGQAAQAGGAAPQVAEPDQQPREVKTAIVRSLLKRLEEMQLSPEEEKIRDELRYSLMDADEELSYALGDPSRQLVLEGDKKPARLGLRQSGKQTKGPRLVTPQPATPLAAPARKPRTPIVRALIDALPAIEGDGEDTRDALREHLLDADSELSRVLGKNSKRLIEQANRKPQIQIFPGAPAQPQPRLRTPPPSVDE